MRTAPRPHRITRTALAALAAFALVVAAPAAALAADVPDEMVDPVGAMEPEIQVGEPAGDPADAQIQGEATGIATPEAQAAAEQPVAGAAATPARPATDGSGYLPFTGPADGLLMLLFLVGSVAILGGLTAVAHARAVAETP